MVTARIWRAGIPAPEERVVRSRSWREVEEVADAWGATRMECALAGGREVLRKLSGEWVSMYAGTKRGPHDR